MPSYDEARRIILENTRPLGVEQASPLEAVGRVLGQDVVAPWDFPAFDNSAMDGYAVRAADVPGPAVLRLSGYLAAGDPGGAPLQPGTAAKILTGAPVPPGADAIVPFEETEERDGALHLRTPVKPGAHVRRKGEDIRAGERILPAGTLVGPPEVSLLASCSRLSVPVFRRPRVAILATGDELVEPGEPLSPGKIYNSNALALAAAVASAGCLPTLLGIASDDRPSLRARLAEGLQADVLITSAGVSMGDRDLVREVLAELEVRQLFWKIEIKPGRPTAFAVRGGTLVFSLPGNPVSTLLTFEQFVRPALRKLMGHRKLFRAPVAATFQGQLSRKPGKVGFIRVRLERRGGELFATSAGNQDTGILKTMLLADGIAVLPESVGDLRDGARVEVEVLRDGFDLREA
jgi:molybdopterin molybdotransferase